MIEGGIKLEEYRDVKWFWIRRLTTIGLFPPVARLEVEFDLQSNDPESVLKEAGAKFKHFDVVRFKNGYSKNARTMDVQFVSISINGGVDDWGAMPSELYFVIRLGKVLTASLTR